MAGALADLRVVELATGVAGAFCGKLLADLGATVLRIEIPGADALRRYGPFPGDRANPAASGLHLHLNEGKLGTTLDPGRPADRDEIASLAGAADVLVESLAPAAGDWVGRLRAERPGLVVASITPFGLTGPCRDRRAGELGLVHASGLGFETPFNQVDDPERQPPLKPFGHQAGLVAGWTAAAASLVALRRRDATGEGDRIDVSELEAVLGTLRPNFAFASHEPPEGSNRARLVRRSTWGLPWIWRAADGWVSVAVIADAHWTAIRGMMGDPEWARSPLFETARGRYQNSDALRPALADWIAGEPRDRLYREGQARHVPVFPLQTVSDLLGNEHLAVRGFFRRVTEAGAGEVVHPGYPYRWSATPPGRQRPAPPPTADDRDAFRAACAAPPGSPDPSAPPAATTLPLAGVRVLDFGWVVAVPFATSWLGALGADVVRVESITRPDPARFLAMVPGAKPGPDASPYFNHLNLSKRSIALDLAHPEARDVVRRLVPRCDVVAENFTVGHLEKWGLDFEHLRRLRRDVILLSASPLGQTGPEARCVGWGPNTQAWAGVCSLTGYAGGPPCGLGGTWPDFTAALAVAFAILAALRHRDRTGEGQRIDLALAEVILSMIPEAFLEASMNGRVPARQGNADPVHAPHGVYRCAGADAWIAISVEDDAEWPGLARALGEPAWAASCATAALRRAARAEIDAALARFVRSRDPFDVERELQAAGVRALAVRNAEDLLRDPHLAARSPWVAVDHPVTGSRPILGFPARFGGFAERLAPAPRLGADTGDVLADVAGLGAGEIAGLRARGVLR